MNFTRSHQTIIITCIFLFTTGFTDLFMKEEVYSKTENFLNQTKSTTKPSKEITGLETRELVPYVPYQLNPIDIDPFAVKPFVRELGKNQVTEDSDNCDTEDCGDGPPVPHAPFFLEGYSLDQLAMIGTLSNPARGKVALILTPDAGIVYAAVGEYIGRNYGLIIAIEREGIVIQEKYRTPRGWQNRNATLPLIRN